jgi:hypothetical protein
MKMHRLASNFYLAAAIFAVIGMAWGIQMSITDDHSLSPAHAHNNLIGFVVMAIYGTFYALNPAAADTGLARAHFGMAVLSGVTIGPGIVLVIRAENPLLAQIASAITLLTMLVFVWVILRSRRT